MSISTFTTDQLAYTSKISSYQYLDKSNSVENTMRNPSLRGKWNNEKFGRTNIKIAMMRPAYPKTTAYPYPCNTKALMQKAIQQLNHAMRLWSGNQIGLNISRYNGL